MASQGYKDRRIKAAKERNVQRKKKVAQLNSELAAVRLEIEREDTHISWLQEMPVDDAPATPPTTPPATPNGSGDH